MDKQRPRLDSACLKGVGILFYSLLTAGGNETTPSSSSVRQIFEDQSQIPFDKPVGTYGLSNRIFVFDQTKMLFTR